MKKKITLSLLAISGYVFAQNPTGRLVPDETNPTGLIYNYNADNYTYYTSEYVPNAADAGTIGTAEGNLKYTGKKSTSTFQQATYRIEAGKNIDIDISSNPIVYIKLKGTLGDIAKVSLKNNSYKDQDDNDVPERYFGGYNIRQTITCSDYSWYKFDFTGIYAQEAPTYSDIPGTNVAASKNHIKGFEITNDGDLTGRVSYDFYIDSVIMGNAGIVPVLPKAVVNTKWISPFGAFTPPTLDYTYSNTAGNTCQKVNNENVFSYTAQNSKDAYETNYQIYGTSGKITLDIRKNPVIKATISGNVGDTIRFNLKQANFSFIDGYSSFKVIKTTGYQDYEFDFSSQVDKLINIAEISMNLYPTVAFTASSFKMSRLVVGGDVEYCSFEPTGILDEVFSTPSKTNVYPNPATAGENVFIAGNMATEAEIVSLTGVSIKSIQVSNNQFTIPADMQSGLYVVRLKGQKINAVSKLQIK